MPQTHPLNSVACLRVTIQDDGSGSYIMAKILIATIHVNLIFKRLRFTAWVFGIDVTHHFL